MNPVEMGDGHPVCAMNRAVRIDLEIRAVARSDAADQNRLAAAMVVGGRQQGREVELIAFADREASAVTLVVVGDVIDDRRGRLRIGQCRGVEYEFVGAGTSSQSGAGPARDSVRQIVTAAGEVGRSRIGQVLDVGRQRVVGQRGDHRRVRVRHLKDIGGGIVHNECSLPPSPISVTPLKPPSLSVLAPVPPSSTWFAAPAVSVSFPAKPRITSPVSALVSVSAPEVPNTTPAPVSCAAFRTSPSANWKDWKLWTMSVPSGVPVRVSAIVSLPSALSVKV